MDADDRRNAIRATVDIDSDAVILELNAKTRLTKPQVKHLIDTYEAAVHIHAPNGFTDNALAYAQGKDELTLSSEKVETGRSPSIPQETRQRATMVPTDVIRSRMLQTLFGTAGTPAARLALLLQQFRGGSPLNVFLVGSDGDATTTEMVSGIRGVEEKHTYIDCAATSKERFIQRTLPSLIDNELLLMDNADDFNDTFDFLHKPMARQQFTNSAEEGYTLSCSFLAHLRPPAYHADFASMLNALPFGRVRAQFDVIASLRPDAQPPSLPITLDTDAQPLPVSKLQTYRRVANTLHPSLDSATENYLTEQVAEQRKNRSVEPYRQAEMTRAVIRLSRAAARTELRSTVKQEDVDLAIALLTLDVGLSTTTEEYDDDVSAERVLLDILTVLEGEYESGVPEGLLLGTAQNSVPNENMSKSRLKQALNELVGETVAEPTTETYVRVRNN